MKALNLIQSEEVINNYLINRDVNEFSLKVLELIKNHGYVHVNQEASVELFNLIGSILGDVIHQDIIEVKPNGSFAAYRSEEVLPHTDTADAHIMGWWCQQQDELDGCSILIDTKNVLKSLSDEEIKLLSSVSLKYTSSLHRTKDSFAKFDELPLIYKKWGQFVLNYAPWLEIETKNLQEFKAVSKFKNELARAILEDRIEIALKPGQFLFIDNGRLLHSRRAIPISSKRRLKRMWINTGAIK